MDKLSLSTLGRHIQELRVTRGLSLSQLALGAGIAKSNLSRLEQGVGNPTLDTIWRLATTLDIPFGNLVAPVSEPVEENGVTVRLIDQGRDSPQVDVYWMSISPSTLREAEAHPVGTRESITLVSGQLTVGTQSEEAILTPGQSFSFSADSPHFYNASDQWVTAIVTVIYPEESIK
jgi:transcriptional regulator with XRE-family HTH domain